MNTLYTPDQPSHPFATLSPDRVLDAVESLGAYSNGRCMALNSYENRVFQVGMEDAPTLIVKFYRPERWQTAQILEEHAFVGTLAEAGAPVVAPISDQGNTLHEAEGFRFALYPQRPGQAPELDNPDHLFRLGEMMGRIHRVGTLQDYQHRPTLNVAQWGRPAREAVLTCPWLKGEQSTQYAALSDQLLTRIEEIMAPFEDQAIRLHGDAHVGNVLCRDDDMVLVDFDDSRMGPAIQDLWMLITGATVAEQREQLSELIEGYEQVFEFPRAQLKLVECLRTLRLIHHSGWIVQRWHDPAFPQAFPWVKAEGFWDQQLKLLTEQSHNLTVSTDWMLQV